MTNENDMGGALSDTAQHNERERIHPLEIDNIQTRDEVSGKWLQIDRLASMGWRQFPCHSAIGDRCSCGSAACGAKAKHPRTEHGVKEATADRNQLWAWHHRWPNANWALATGSASGLVVIDLDPAKGGFDSWDEYEMNRRVSDFPLTTQVRTGGQGRHLILSYPRGRRVRNRVNWLPGVDVRGDGGYVILPGSRHISGGTYEWLNPGVPVAAAPDDLLEAISASRASRRGGAGESSSGTFTTPTQELRERGFRHSERDNGFNSLAWRLVRQHWPHIDLIMVIMREVYDRTDQDDDFIDWSVVVDKVRRAWVALEPELLAQRQWAQGLRRAK